MAGLNPDEYLTSVTRIDLDELADEGYSALLLDLDNTILPRGSDTVPDDVRDWVEHAKAKGFTCVIVSNNFRAITPIIARSLGAGVITKAFKPLPSAFHKVFRTFGLARRDCVVIGDQLFTDIWGARLLGMRAIMVQPQAEEQVPHIIMFHRMERLFMGGRKPTR